MEEIERKCHLMVAVSIMSDISNWKKKESNWIDFIDFHWRLGIGGLSIGSIWRDFLPLLPFQLLGQLLQIFDRYIYWCYAMYSGQLGSFASRDILLFFSMRELESISVHPLLSVRGEGKTFIFGHKVHFVHCECSIFPLIRAWSMGL